MSLLALGFTFLLSLALRLDGWRAGDWAGSSSGSVPGVSCVAFGQEAAL